MFDKKYKTTYFVICAIYVISIITTLTIIYTTKGD